MEREKFSVRQELPCFDHLRFSERQEKIRIKDKIKKRMLLELQAYLWKEQAFEEVIRYPRDWWEAFKEHWFPVWLKRRCPVQYKETTINIDRIYPYLKYSLPEEKSVLVIHCH